MFEFKEYYQISVCFLWPFLISYHKVTNKLTAMTDDQKQIHLEFCRNGTLVVKRTHREDCFQGHGGVGPSGGIDDARMTERGSAHMAMWSSDRYHLFSNLNEKA